MSLSKERFLQLLKKADFRSSRSSGKGGQHVNTTATKAELRIPVWQTEILTQKEEELINSKLKNRINDKGELIIQQEVTRSLLQNKHLAEDRAYELLQEALHVPKRRKPTKPSKGARQRMMEKKKQHAEKKARRRWNS
ncbi:MAG: peptide chain release factor-like protein [Bacteroidales bacterium]